MTQEEEMSDTEMWASYKLMKAQKRASNREAAMSTLGCMGVPFTTSNQGAHLIVRGLSGQYIDFWPGTGFWKVRGQTPPIEGRGIMKLVKRMNLTAHKKPEEIAHHGRL